MPGVSTYYATTCRECSAGCGVIAETRDGRAIKLEGNPDHPLNHGALCARAVSRRCRASTIPIVSAADGAPGRPRWKPTTWDEALSHARHAASPRPAPAARRHVAFINQHESGSFPGVSRQLAGARAACRRTSAYDFEADLAASRANRRIVRRGVAVARLHGGASSSSRSAPTSSTAGARAFRSSSTSPTRAPSWRDAPRFVYIGPRRSLTGLNADEWIACTPGQRARDRQCASRRGRRERFGNARRAAQASGVDAATLERLAAELRAATPSLVLAGATRPRCARRRAGRGRAESSALGDVGTTIKPAEPIAALDGCRRRCDAPARRSSSA